MNPETSDVRGGQGRPTTTYADAVRHFVGRSQRARGFLERWRHQPDKREKVVPFVEAAKTQLAYALEPADVERACERTEHALGDIRRTDAMSVTCIVDWHPSFALQHVFHYMLESTGRVPTYQALREFCASDPQARKMLLEPARERLRYAQHLGFSARVARDAMQWRVGNAYLSFMRELYVLAILRRSGVDARYHVLADVLFRVDFWVGSLCFSVFVQNPRFRAGANGRKIPAPTLLEDGGFTFARLELPVRHEYGTVHLPDPTETRAALRRIRSAR